MRAVLLTLLMATTSAPALAAPGDKTAAVDKPARQAPPDQTAAALLGAKAADTEIAGLTAKRDKLGGLSAEDQRRLQQAMDRRSLFEAQISNVLKANEQIAHGVAGSPKDP